MNDKKTIFSFAIIFLNFLSLVQLQNKFDGVYKSEFFLGVNRFFYIDDKCPSKLPITVNLRVG